jgi:hypothetical protein
MASMGIGKRLALVTALCLACAVAFAAAAQGWGVKYASGPDPAVERWPSWPYPASCLGVTFDPVAVFDGPTEAENGSGGPELALRRYLDEGLYPQVPTRFWRLVAAGDTQAFFASGRLEQGLFWLTVQLVDGQWRVDGEVDECRARTFREGDVAVRWDLAPGQGLTAKSRRVQVKLSRREGCNGGRSLNAAADPVFRRVEKRLLLTVWVEPPPPGVYTCERRREPPLTVSLPGRLGKRQLWDGGSYPPRREF